MAHTLICVGLHFGMMERWKGVFLERLPKQKKCQRFSDSNEKYQRLKPCLGANEKTILIEINFIITVAQHFEKYLRAFQAEGLLIHYLFSEKVSQLRILMMRFLKKKAIADLTANQLAKLDIEWEDIQVNDFKANVGHKVKILLQSIDCRKITTTCL